MMCYSYILWSSLALVIYAALCGANVENLFRFIFPLQAAVNKDVAMPRFTFKSLTVADDADCVLECYSNVKCLAINVGSPNSQGHRKCELKEVMVTHVKWLDSKTGFSYYYFGK